MPSNQPRPYPTWRTNEADREEDAAYTFGYHLIQHCRAEAMKAIESAVITDTASFRLHAEKAIDLALHNVMALLEGFWPLQSGPDLRVAYELTVRVSDPNGTELEDISISPCLIDLPIGYWKWRDGEYQ